MLELGRVSGRGRFGGVDSRKLRGFGAIGGWDIDGGRGGKLDAVRAVAFKHVGNVVGHGRGDGAGDTVVFNGKTKERVSDGVGFDMIFSGEGIYQSMKMGNVFILYAIVIDDKGEVDGVDGMGEEAGLKLVVAMCEKQGGDLLVGVEASLPETIHGFVNTAVKK